MVLRQRRPSGLALALPGPYPPPEPPRQAPVGAIANLANDELSHPAPVFHGDTLFVASEVLEVKPSQSKPDRGVVRVHTGPTTRTAEFKRAVLVPRRPER